MTMTAANAILSLRDLRRDRLPRLAAGLAAAAAASLPWSTSATGILASLWLVTSLPTLDLAALRREVLSAPGGLPVVLVGLAVAGLLWSDVSASERFYGIEPFLRLLMIPVLFAQFRRSDRGMWVGAAFLMSGTVLLALVWIMFYLGLDFGHGPGVPVKDYITQSGVFTLCAFALAYIGFEQWTKHRRALAIAEIALALLFIASIFYVSTSRTTLVVIPVLLLLMGLQRASWRATAACVLAGLMVLTVMWTTSPYVRLRATSVADEIAESELRETSSGARLEFWKNSLVILREAPILGHGIGTITETFRRHADPKSTATATNPHNQIFAVGIQLGVIGVAALLAMWTVHWQLFRRPGLAAWIGLIAVTQNIVGSLFNSHLMDFTQSWIYVFAVAVFGGVVLHDARAVKPEDPPAHSQVSNR
ncbi:MAG TPA: O-antigen ligase family protein [Xanthobacteraceae bacterium]|nr:O-antigen ligase family protein [Xanthobacteraceae bacterium]